MRQWSRELGEEIQRADIKCGPLDKSLIALPYLSAPFRMKGPNWVGVSFEAGTDDQIVKYLLDKAFSENNPIDRFTVSLEASQPYGSNVYKDTPINRQRKVASQGTLPGVLKVASHNIPHDDVYIPQDEVNIPEPIHEMLALYEYGDGSFEQKCKNFFVQGTFMENYEDNVPWDGPFIRYFTTYHDLNIPQLRGYFTWRTHYRKGKVLPTSTSFAYIYVYELLNGIGTSSKEDALLKLDEFVEKYIDSGIGDSRMKRYLNMWRYEYAIVNGFPAEVASKYESPEISTHNKTLEVLKDADTHSDIEVFNALLTFTKKGQITSPVLNKYPQEGVSLFAQSWREAMRDGLLDACFGIPLEHKWRPLSNAVVWQHKPHADTIYQVNSICTYYCRNNTWTVQRYDSLFFNAQKQQEFIRGVDKLLRSKLKTGHYLKDRQSEEWIEPYVDKAIRTVKKAREEAARPKIEIDATRLDKIRDDAAITRESLLTEEDTNDGASEIITFTDSDARGNIPQEGIIASGANETNVASDANVADKIVNNEFVSQVPLDATEQQILMSLLDGNPVKSFLKDNLLMASVVADSINEALFEEIGDNVVESDGSDITLVEDYRSDVEELLRGA